MTRFVVIGCGGIGGDLAEGLVRILAFRRPEDSVLVLVDGDHFEAKNRERQVFAEAGNKANVWAARLAPMFPEVLVVPIDRFVVADDAAPVTEADPAAQPAGRIGASALLEDGDVIYAVVDNFKARADVLASARNLANVDVFLGGNDDEYFGTVLHYCRRDGHDVTEDPAFRHPEYVEPPDRNPGEMNCAERAALVGATQLIGTNKLVAALLLQRTQRVIIDGHPEDAAEIHCDGAIPAATGFDRRETSVEAGAKA